MTWMWRGAGIGTRSAGTDGGTAYDDDRTLVATKRPLRRLPQSVSGSAMKFLILTPVYRRFRVRRSVPSARYGLKCIYIHLVILM